MTDDAVGREPTPIPIFGQFGQALAYAERTMTAVLREHLAKLDTVPETWYALRLIATHGPHYSRAELSHELEGSRSLDRVSTRALLARVASEGLIDGDEVVDLTPHGEAVYQNLREHISGPTARLLGQFDVHDIETTVRTLQAIAARATEPEVAE